jgi:hypothetical protein
MAILHPRPPQVNGATFDKLGVELAIRTTPRGGEMVLDIIVTFEPYRDRANGPEILQAGRVTKVFPNALALAAQDAQEGDLHLAQFLSALESAAQQYISAKI